MTRLALICAVVLALVPAAVAQSNAVPVAKTNLTFLVLSTSLVTNADVLEVRGPGFSPRFSPAFDHVIVTNVPAVRQVLRVTWDGGTKIVTNLVPLATNIAKWVWKEERTERRPLEVRDTLRPEPLVPPQGLGVRQPSGALEVVGDQKRQRAGALQDAAAPPLPPGLPSGLTNRNRNDE